MRYGVSWVAIALLIAACGGITAPDGARWIGYELASQGRGPVVQRPAIAAATSLHAARDMAMALSSEGPLSYCGGPTRDCWPDAPDRTSLVYVLVAYFSSCNRDTTDDMALGGNTLYFVHWIGAPRGVCNALMALPSLRLFTVSRSQLPHSGRLSVELVIEDSSAGESVAANTSVDLG